MKPNPFLRNLFHLLGILVPLLYLHLGDLFLYLFFPLATLFLLLEFFRLQVAVAGEWYLRLFGPLLRPGEYDRPSGAFYFALGTVLTILLFPGDIAVSALLVLALSDPAAAIIGRRYGKRRIFGKTLAGSLAFFLSAWFTLTIYFGDNLFRQLPAALLGTLVEALPSPLNDNLTIPVAVGLAGYLMLR
ncbi:MAG: SEC59/DGK1/VTE5 family protein [Smithellaceae bacterium]|nr:SEC59/DGK1/VTE5 family protein [Smithellaceae bacterium]